ncbi:MAG TPA: signal peptidase II [Candidatus Absconditabacterales bacterium]|nr:signal peptidase II [Candidatus Absconditabacterales bacterium]
MKKNLTTIIFTTSLILLDQISKYFFYNKGFLNNLEIIQSTLNTGISRSLPIPQLITIILTIAIITLLILMYKKNKISKRVIIFLIAGAIGNLIDRIFLGGVKDFIKIFDRFPIFNLADISINIGVILLIIKELFAKGQKSSGKNKYY